MFKIIYSRLIILSLTLPLAGCFSTINTEPNNYTLSSVPSVITKKRSSDVLLINLPQTNSAYDTVQMAYMKNQYQLSYFAKNCWASPPSQMLLPLMVQTLQNTHAFRAVVPQSVAGHVDLVLDTQLVQLQQEFFDKTSQIHLVMRAQLINVNTQHIVATKEFNIIETAMANNPYAGAVAANHAVNKFLQQLAIFCVNKI